MARHQADHLLSLRVVSFNLLFGAYEPPDRWDRILRLLWSLKPDLLLLQECMDWDQVRLERLGEELGLPHSFLTQTNPRGSGKRYCLGALSRDHMRGESLVPPCLAHGLQRVQIDGWDFPFFNLHLVAGAEAERMNELEYVLSQISDGGVLMGDLNSLSPRDPYQPGSAENLWSAGCHKYGVPFSFHVMETLFQDGWCEPERLGSEWVTRWRTETKPATPTRTDYALVKGDARSRARHFQVHPLTQAESDHCPLILELSEANK